MGTSLGRSSRQSLAASTNSLNTAYPQFARALQGTQPPLISMSDDMHLRQRVPSWAASVNAGGFDIDFRPAAVQPLVQEHYTSPNSSVRQRRLSVWPLHRLQHRQATYMSIHF